MPLLISRRRQRPRYPVVTPLFFMLLGLAPGALGQMPDVGLTAPPPHTFSLEAPSTWVILGAGQASLIRHETATVPPAFNAHPTDDPWLAPDKLQHMAFSGLLTINGQYLLTQKAHVSAGRALPWAVGSTALIGLAKEWYDLRRGPRHHFSRRDLAANAVGILLATTLIIL